MPRWSWNPAVGKIFSHVYAYTLTYKSYHCCCLQDRRIRRLVARETLDKLKVDTVAIANKKAILLKQWPLIFIEMVKEAVVDMHDLNQYIRTEGGKFETDSS